MDEGKKRKRSSNKEGEEEIGTILGLPIDIALDILSRLPIKSLTQCKCVCKSWRALLLDPRLANLHLDRASKSKICSLFLLKRCQGPLFLEDAEASDKPIEFPFPFHGCCPLPIHNWVGSCNGLVCIYSFSRKAPYILNPFTGEFKKLPKFSLSKNFFTTYLGFGFSPSTNEHKVVKLMLPIVAAPSLSHYAEVEVYNLGSSSWRKIGNTPFKSRSFYSNVCLNGSLYWITKEYPGNEIVSFDLKHQEFRVVSQPSQIGEWSSYKYCARLDVLGGFLSLSINFNHQLEIWVMKECESWTRQFVFSTDDMDMVFPLCFLENGEIVLECLTKLVYYDPESRRFRDLIATSQDYPSTVSIVGSLVSLRAYGVSRCQRQNKVQARNPNSKRHSNVRDG